MGVTSFPAGLPNVGYSMQAAAIASALVERENAADNRAKLREWLDVGACNRSGVCSQTERFSARII